MATNGTRKLFSAELKMLEAQAGADAGAIEPSPSFHGASRSSAGNGSVSNQDLLSAITALSNRIGGGGDLELAETEDIPAPDADLEQDMEMAHNMRSELRAMARSIKETKSEIKAMRVGGKGDDTLLTASSELDAVVMATEEATDSILNASETIEALAAKIHLNAVSDEDRQAT